jgi:hypothetical protein
MVRLAVVITGFFRLISTNKKRAPFNQAIHHYKKFVFGYRQTVRAMDRFKAASNNRGHSIEKPRVTQAIETQ